MNEMLRQFCLLLISMVPTQVLAFPDGAPWGSAYPASPSGNCASCHNDLDAEFDSLDVSLSVLPLDGTRMIIPGETVKVYLQFRNPDNKKIGFQIIADVGTFKTDRADVEVKGRLARSKCAQKQSDLGTSKQLGYGFERDGMAIAVGNA